jgi:selenium metabolism protein YedF
MKEIDLRGLACPEPVIRTKKAIEANPSSVLAVLLNDAASRANVTRMAQSLGARVEGEELPGGELRLTIATGQAKAAPAAEPMPCGAAPAGRATVFIRNHVMGHGDERLGRILMKAFLKTLRNADPLPADILFVNNGVHLTAEGSEELPTLQELAGLGVEIVSCGTCLDFFGKLDKVKVGVVGNMLEIVTRLNRAAKIISP